LGSVLSDEAFYRLFERIRYIVILVGATTQEEINRRVQAALNQRPSSISSGWRRFIRLALPDFGRRCIDEAIANPNGKVALNFKYSPEIADRILEKRVQRYLEHLREKAKRKKRRRIKW
jgi:hypothetical protein